MTDYNVTVNNYEDYGNSERHEGRITLDGVRLVWVYDGFNKALIHVACYQMLPTDAKMRTRNRLGDGTRLRRIPISKRSDFRAIRRAIGHEINKYHEDEEAYEALHPRDGAEREANNGTTANLGMEGDSGGTSPAGISPLDNPQDRAR